jgi:hypothetical protein
VFPFVDFIPRQNPFSLNLLSNSRQVHTKKQIPILYLQQKSEGLYRLIYSNFEF